MRARNGYATQVIDCPERQVTEIVLYPSDL